MNQDFQALISQLSLTEVRFLDSHESVLADEPPLGTGVTIDSAQAFANDDPLVNGNAMIFRMKYMFNFSVGKKVFFKAEYVAAINFTAQDPKQVKKLLSNSEVKDLFYKKQLTRTMWSILRGTIMDAFNRHSLHPVQLPWML